MTEDNPKILDKFAVLHVDECGDVVEKPSEVTASSHSSPRAVLMKMGFPVKIKCNVLMYYKPNTRFLKLHVFVIPLDPALQQMVDKKESSSGYEKIIKKPRPDKYLKMQQRFTLTADIDTAEIHPKEITLRYNNQGPNFYEVYIKNPDRKFNMTLHPYSKKSEAVWTCKIQKGDHPSSGPVEEKHSVDEQLSAQLHKAATISSDRERIQKMMEHLTEPELKEFKWTLEDQNFILMLDLPNIPISELDKADMLDLVDLMIQAYRQRSVEVTKKVFKKMNRNDLVLMLSEIISGQKEKHSVDEAAAASRQEVPMTSMIEKLQETLDGLNEPELNHFKWILQKTVRQRDLPRILSSRMDGADRGDVVELMVAMYSEQSVDVIREVFRKMNRNDLVQKLPEISSASEGDSTNLELEGCESVVQQDSSVWTKLEPEVNNADTDEAPTYSLQSEAGQFECSVSRLRWVCEENSSFKYQFHSWGGYMERMESRQYMPAGALINISIIAGKLTEVHLPHWICIEDNPEILDKFAILHIDECGDVVEKPSEVTASHVKLTQPKFSLRGVLIKLGFPVKTECNVLMYYKTNTSFLKLHVYVIPLDPALQQTVDKKESSSGYEGITKPRPDKHLKMKQRFCLTADIDTATIHPKEITLKYTKDPNFCEVFIENPDRELNMTLHPYSKKNEAVWSCAIRKDDHPSSGPVEAADSSTGSCSYAAVGAAGSSSGSTGVSTVADEKHSVDEQLSAQLHKAVTITSDRERIQKMMEHLKEPELKEFKWTLEDSTFMFMLDLPNIPRCKLDKADMLDLVDLMIQAYSQRSVEVTKKVFKKMNRNDLVEMLSDSSS